MSKREKIIDGIKFFVQTHKFLLTKTFESKRKKNNRIPPKRKVCEEI